MGIELDGAVAVITGGGSGIGRAAAHAFSARGARIVVTDIDGTRASAVAVELGDPTVAQVCDVSSFEDLEAVRDLALGRFGRVDLVMNNVGVLAVGPVESIPLEAWQRTIDLNLLSVVRSNLVFLPLLLEQGSGHLVNTASAAGLLPYGFDRLPYTATKHAIVGLSEALALYLRPRGIGVSCFCPAGVATNIIEQITFYGEPARPVGPPFPVIDAALAGELVAQGVADGKFLILSAPEVVGEMQRRAADIDAYLRSGGSVEQ
jgi:NAD(P)-dependent dehydrogenase (short-subunit alcohol dehydrogenase family)